MSDPRVAAFLAEFRLIEHLEAFARRRVTYEALPSLTEADLLDLGLIAPADRRRILAAIRETVRFSPGPVGPTGPARSPSSGATAGGGSPDDGAGGFLPGQTLRGGRYRVERLLGAGGMGTVYAATDLTNMERVALKVLLPELSNHPTARQRMEGEARALYRIRSANVVELRAVFNEDGLLVLGLEFMAGGSLDQQLDGKGVSPDLARAWTSQILRGLEALHAAGLVHRDLKPANILLDEHGTLKVTDLGIAQDSQRQGDLRTRHDANLGTAEYMAPEQIQSAATVDARADVYAAGIILYELLTGAVPFGGNEFAVKAGHVQRQPDLGAVRARCPELVWVVARALEKNPDQRFASAAAFRAALFGETAKQRVQPEATTPPPPDARPESRPFEPPTSRPGSLQEAWERDYRLPGWLARREGVKRFRQTAFGAWLARLPHWLVSLVVMVLLFGTYFLTCGFPKRVRTYGRYGAAAPVHAPAGWSPGQRMLSPRVHIMRNAMPEPSKEGA
jgi:serine/threonine protein kinase